MDCSTPGAPVLHCLPELTQTHVHWVGDVQPSHPLTGVTRDWCMIKMAQSKWQRVGRGMDWEFGIRRCKLLSAGWINSQVLLHSTVQFSLSVLSDSLRLHGLQHARLPCPSPIHRASSNSCPLSWWCHPTISSSVVPFSSCLQSFPVSGSFLMSQLFASGSQSIRASASASVLPMNIQDWFPLGLTSFILQSKRLSSIFSQKLSSKASILHHSAFFMVQLTSIHDYWKNHSFDKKYEKTSGVVEVIEFQQRYLKS